MDFIAFLIIVVAGFGVANIFRNELSEGALLNLKKIWPYHILFGLYFCFFVKGDASGYWLRASELTPAGFIVGFTEAKGTYFMYSFNYLPAKVLGLSYFVGAMLYTLLGYIGICFFYVTAYKLIPYNSEYKGYKLFPLLFFLPNLHFWSVAVGKDVLLFLCIGAVVYGVINPIKRLPLIVFGLLLSYFIRPHITLFMALAFGLSYVTSSKIPTYQRILFSGAMLAIGIAILPTVMEFAKIEETSTESFDKFAQEKASVLSRSHTGSSVDISNYPLPLKIFTFLYRPLFVDGFSPPAILASFENLFLLLLSFEVLRNRPIAAFRKSPMLIKALLIFLAVGTLAFSQSMGNLGIMIRMRNMFLPGMIMAIMWSFSYQQLINNANAKS